MNNFGAILSTHDSRDYSIKASAMVLPPSYMLPNLPTVRNQGAVGSCVAHASAEAGEVYDDILLSTDFIYGYRLSEPYGAGMSVREACETMLKKGNVELGVLPSNTENPACYRKVQSQLSKLLPEAEKHKIKSYARVYTAQEVKEALYAGIPVICVVWCYGDFSADPDSHVLINTPESGTHAQGAAHAMLIVGYNGDYFRVQNSWGTNWGDGGYCWMSKNMLENANEYTPELWVIADEKQSKEVIDKTPSNKLYKVQVGAFRNKAYAQAMQEKLKKAGFDGYITSAEV